VDDIAEGQVKSREHVVGVVWFILAPSLAFLRHEQFVVTTIEIGSAAAEIWGAWRKVR
jgi:hypothetical protein